MKRLYVLVAAAVAAILVTATAIAGLGPESEPQIGARELPTKLAYGDRGRADAPDVTPRGAADLPTPKSAGLPASVPAPGVLPTPARAPITDKKDQGGKKTDEEPAPAVTPAPVPSVPATASDACPAATGASASPDAAPLGVDGVPAAGTYRFRQTGTTRGAAGLRPVAPLIDRVYEGAKQVSKGVQRFDVRVTENGATSVSTFEIDQRGFDDGVYLVSTRSSDLDALNFVPALRVRLLPLPAAANAKWTSIGTDPLTGSSMVVNGRVVGRDEVDACGTLISGWKVEIGSDAAGPSISLGPGGAQQFSGTLVIATGAGGAVVAEDIQTKPLGGGEAAKRTATLSQEIKKAG